MVFVGGSSIFPPGTNGVIICVVEMPVVTTSAITPDPGVGSIPILLEASFALDVLSVYSRNQPAVDNPTFIKLYALNPEILTFPIALSARDDVTPETTVLDFKDPPKVVIVAIPALNTTSSPVPKSTVLADPILTPSSSTTIPFPGCAGKLSNKLPSIAGNAPSSCPDGRLVSPEPDPENCDAVIIPEVLISMVSDTELEIPATDAYATEAVET